MRASSPASAFCRPRQIVIAPAAPWDIFFLAWEVAAGSRLGYFAPAYSNPKEQRTLTWRCARAILGRAWGFRRLVKPIHFVVARIGSETVGAAFAHPTQDANGERVTTIEFLVVHSGFRRLGVGEALMRYLAAKAPCPDVLQCWCAPQSHAMKHLLRSEGFNRVINPSIIQAGDQSRPTRMMMPSLWEKRRDVVSMAAPHKNGNTSAGAGGDAVSRGSRSAGS
jgi:ribosomal protein S18 acetylase RimI-like enzyme